jgi:predicted RNase H-like HicB family nuclease
MTASGVTYSTDTVVTGPMESTDRDRYRERLLVERIAALFGFAKLADRIPRWNPYPPYLFYGFWILFDIGVLNVYRHLTGGRHAFLVDPFWIAIPLGLVLATKRAEDQFAQFSVTPRVCFLAPPNAYPSDSPIRIHDRGREIRLIEEDDGGWSAIDEETGVASQGDTRREALSNLDEAVALHRGDIGEPVSDDDLLELGIDPETIPDGPQEPDAPWFEE